MIDDVVHAPETLVLPDHPAFHSSIGKHRGVLVRHAYELAGAFGARTPDEQRECVPQLSALLAESLESLRVAEEELRVQNEELQRAQIDAQQKVAHFQDLFELAPSALFVTDSYGHVLEANREAAVLTGRDRGRIIHRPMISFIVPDHRRAFREGFSRLGLTSGAEDWHLVVDKLGVPVDVKAIVRVLDRTVGRGAYYWSLTPALGSAT